MDDIFDELSKRIRQIRLESRLSQEKFAEALGVSLPTVTRIEKGRASLDFRTLYKLTTTFKVNPVWLFFGKENLSEYSSYKKIPIFTESQLLSGENVHETDKSWVHFPGLPENCFLLKTNETAMIPKIQPGDFIIVANEEHTWGDTILYKNEFGNLLIRKLGIQENGNEFLIAENPDYPPIQRNGKEKIFGKVTGGIRNYSV